MGRHLRHCTMRASRQMLVYRGWLDTSCCVRSSCGQRRPDKRLQTSSGFHLVEPVASLATVTVHLQSSAASSSETYQHSSCALQFVKRTVGLRARLVSSSSSDTGYDTNNIAEVRASQVSGPALPTCRWPLFMQRNVAHGTSLVSRSAGGYLAGPPAWPLRF